MEKNGGRSDPASPEGKKQVRIQGRGYTAEGVCLWLE